MSEPANHLCPNFMSHYENATERRFPNWCTAGHRRTLTTEEDQAITADAEQEYMRCEGHD